MVINHLLTGMILQVGGASGGGLVSLTFPWWINHLCQVNLTKNKQSSETRLALFVVFLGLCWAWWATDDQVSGKKWRAHEMSNMLGVERQPVPRFFEGEINPRNLFFFFCGWGYWNHEHKMRLGTAIFSREMGKCMQMWLFWSSYKL